MKNTLYKVYPRLSTAEMERTLYGFSTCLTQELAGLTEADQLVVNQWIAEVIQYIPPVMLRLDFLQDISDRVFASPAITDFVMAVHYRFVATVSESDDQLSSLTQNLMDGLTIDGLEPDYSVLPEDIAQSTPMAVMRQREDKGWLARLLEAVLGYKSSQFSLFLFLRNNTWLLVILLINLSYVNDTSVPQDA